MSSDREATRIVRSWLEEGVTTIPDRVLDSALDQVPATPQRRPLWPVRRYSEMSTSARLLAAAAAVVALTAAGAAFMLAGGLGPKSTQVPPGPTAPTPTTPRSTGLSGAAGLPEFTACVPGNSQFKEGTTETEVIPGPSGDTRIERTRGFTWKGEITATDPRLSGTHYYSWDGNGYTPGSANPQVAVPNGLASWSEGHRIENADGAWSGSTVGLTLADGTNTGSPAVLTGEGAYKGLTAVLLNTDGTCFFNFRGVVMEVPDPPVPYTGK
jgi:hypothetical protein